MNKTSQAFFIALIATLLNAGCVGNVQSELSQKQQRMENMNSAPVAQSPAPAMAPNWEY